MLSVAARAPQSLKMDRFLYTRQIGKERHIYFDTQEQGPVCVKMDKQDHSILSECLFLKNNRLNHFVKYVMHDQVQEGRYLVVQYLDTSLVDRILDLDYQERLEAIVEYAKEVLLAIKQVHETGNVHCDIRPRNIRFGNGRLFLVDFAAIMSLQDYEGRPVVFMNDYECKTDPHFASLNMLRGNTPGRRDDLEQLAYLVAYLLCVGRIEDDSYWFKIRERPGETTLDRIISEKQSFRYTCRNPSIARMVTYAQFEVQFD